MEEIQPLDPAQASCVLALNNEHAEELSWLDEARLAELVGRAFLARRIGCVDAFLLAFDQMRITTAPISCGSARAIRASSMSTASSSRAERVGAGMRAGCTTISSSMPVAPAINASSARSIASRPIPRRMPSMRRWASARSAAPPSTAEPRPSDI